MLKLDITSLRNAHMSLSRALVAVAKAGSDDKDGLLRDATIQRFEYTYELCHKMLKRYLEMTSPSPSNLDDVGFRELFRLGFEAGLIRHVEQWFVFRERRNITSHAYDEAKAGAVFACIPEFLEESDYFIRAIGATIHTVRV